ncbi:SKP1-like protein 5 [Oryza glaberrima]|nr:SKP1-like protein 5 [Oryza glaberrima]
MNNGDHHAGDNGITIPNVTDNVLAERYCMKHAALSSGTDDVKAMHEEELHKFDRVFVKVDNDRLRRLISAANVMGIDGLIDLACQRMANMLKGKRLKQMRQTSGIDNHVREGGGDPQVGGE